VFIVQLRRKARLFRRVRRRSVETGAIRLASTEAERARIMVGSQNGFECTCGGQAMKRFAPILWVALAIGAIAYWSNADNYHSRASTTTEGDSDDDSADDPGTFHGDSCTVDCSGHKAGYDWAERHDIDDEDNCGGNSESFIEGCKAYVREQQGTNADEDSDEPDETVPDEN
jgi:hypothetical protein